MLDYGILLYVRFVWVMLSKAQQRASYCGKLIASDNPQIPKTPL